MITLLVGIAVGFAANVIVRFWIVLYSLSRAERFGPLMVAEHHDHVVVMFDPEASESSLPCRAARATFGATNTTMWGFPPETARRMARRIAEIADGIDARRSISDSDSTTKEMN